ncbi:MAG: ParB/RepB/Spo0J family partition protein [Candidatus Riflebacteria bacterium]
MSNKIEELKLSQVVETYASLRVVDARSDALMLQSIKTFGQMSPVVCLKTEAGYELIDGFKRLRALKQQKIDTLKCTFIEAETRVGKARIIQLNQASRSISDIEEALVLRSLHLDEKLSQTEISKLVGKDKSWVCRRISLIEKLSEEVQESIRLGLISKSSGRLLGVLPRGNQDAVLDAILKRKLGKRAVERLVKKLVAKPVSHWPTILFNAWSCKSPDMVDDLEPCDQFNGQLKSLLRLQKSVVESAKKALETDVSVPCRLIEHALKNTQDLDLLLNRLLLEKPMED